MSTIIKNINNKFRGLHPRYTNKKCAISWISSFAINCINKNLAIIGKVCYNYINEKMKGQIYLWIFAKHKALLIRLVVQELE